MAHSSRRLLLIGMAGKLQSNLFQVPSFAMPFRSFMEGSKLFVGGISFRTTEDSLREAFSAHGELIDTKIILDRETGRSRGFGFVTFYKEEDADTALAKLNGSNLDGRAIRVDRASARPSRPLSDSSEAGMGFGSSFASNSSESAPADDDWGAIPSLDADVSSDDAPGR